MINGDAVDSGKCIWCGQRRKGLRVFEERPEYRISFRMLPSPHLVCLEHELELDRYVRQFPRRAAMWLAIFVAGMLVVGKSGILGLVGLALIGVASAVFPLDSPMTTSRLGIAPSARLARVIGTVVAAISAGAIVWVISAR
jgi:hypothetical protein